LIPETRKKINNEGKGSDITHLQQFEGAGHLEYSIVEPMARITSLFWFRLSISDLHPVSSSIGTLEMNDNGHF
jgi:hypothetical protein